MAFGRDIRASISRRFLSIWISQAILECFSTWKHWFLMDFWWVCAPGCRAANFGCLHHLGAILWFLLHRETKRRHTNDQNTQWYIQNTKIGSGFAWHCMAAKPCFTISRIHLVSPHLMFATGRIHWAPNSFDASRLICGGYVLKSKFWQLVSTSCREARWGLSFFRSRMPFCTAKNRQQKHTKNYGNLQLLPANCFFSDGVKTWFSFFIIDGGLAEFCEVIRGYRFSLACSQGNWFSYLAVYFQFIFLGPLLPKSFQGTMLQRCKDITHRTNTFPPCFPRLDPSVLNHATSKDFWHCPWCNRIQYATKSSLIPCELDAFAAACSQSPKSQKQNISWSCPM